MLKRKVRRFILFNLGFTPITLLLGLLSSVFVVRLLGLEQFAVVVLVSSLNSLVTKIVGFGIPSAVTRFWIEKEDEITRRTLLAWALLIQSFLALIVLGFILAVPGALPRLLGEQFVDSLPAWGVVGITVAASIRALVTSLLIAELDNKLTHSAGIGGQVLRAAWLIFVSINQVSLEAITAGLIALELAISIILFCSSLKYLPPATFSPLRFRNSQLSFKRFISYSIGCGFLTIYRFLTSIGFITIAFSSFGLLAEAGKLAVIYKVLSVILNVISLPVSKVSGVLFAVAVRDENTALFTKIFHALFRYHVFSFSLVGSGLLFLGSELISVIYDSPVGVLTFNLYFVMLAVSTTILVVVLVAQTLEAIPQMIGIGVGSIVSVVLLYPMLVSSLSLFTPLVINSLIFLVVWISLLGTARLSLPGYLKHQRFLIYNGLALGLGVLLGWSLKNPYLSAMSSTAVFTIVLCLLYPLDKIDREAIESLLPSRAIKYIPSRMKRNWS